MAAAWLGCVLSGLACSGKVDARSDPVVPISASTGIRRIVTGSLETKDGSGGNAFYIGDDQFATCEHVLDGEHLEIEGYPCEFEVTFLDKEDDLAIFRVPHGTWGTDQPAPPSDGDYELPYGSRVLVLGYWSEDPRYSHYAPLREFWGTVVKAPMAFDGDEEETIFYLFDYPGGHRGLSGSPVIAYRNGAWLRVGVHQGDWTSRFVGIAVGDKLGVGRRLPDAEERGLNRE